MIGFLSIDTSGDPCAVVEALRARGISEATPMVGAQFAEVKARCDQQRAAQLQQTPFAPTAPTGPTLNLRTGVTTTEVGDPCRGLASRAKLYGANDPQPTIRRLLVEKCEAQQRAQASSIQSDEPVGYPEPPSMDPKVKIAIGAGAALALGFVAWKVLGK